MKTTAKKLCEVCGVDISKDSGRCTNVRCGMCHTKWCTAGGNTTPGHNRCWPEGHASAPAKKALPQ